MAEENKHISQIHTGSEVYDIHAKKLSGNITIGSKTKPIYISGGEPEEIDYIIEKNVPEDAILTDTTYSFSTGSTAGAFVVDASNADSHQVVQIAGLKTAAFEDAETFTKAAADALDNAKAYTDALETKLLHGADPDTLDGILELVDAVNKNKEVIDELKDIAKEKVSQEDFNAHVNNKSNPHEVSLSTFGIDASADEINILDGVDVANIDADHINYLKGLTGPIKDSLNGKANTAHTHGQGEVEGLEGVLENIRSSITTQVNNEKTRAEDVENDLSARINAIDVSGQINSKLETDVKPITDNLDNRVKTCEGDINDIKGTLASHRADIDSNTARIDELEDQELTLSPEDREFLNFIKQFFNYTSKDKNQFIIGGATLTYNEAANKLEITF